MTRARPWRVAAVAGSLTAAFVLVYLTAISPHLVRHAFEAHHGDHGKATCPLYAQSQLTTAEFHPVPIGIGPPTLMGPLPEQKPAAHPPLSSRSTIRPRSPPDPRATV